MLKTAKQNLNPKNNKETAEKSKELMNFWFEKIKQVTQTPIIQSTLLAIKQVICYQISIYLK